MVKRYLNLTNGLEYMNEIKLFGVNFNLVRIQSTLCEKKCWDKLMNDLDYNFLLDLAQGNTIAIYDTSSKKKVSRALYQGVEFIKYVLYKRWFDREEQAYVKGMNVTNYFRQEYNKLSENTKKKLDYVKKFLNTDKICIETYCRKSMHDGEYEYFKELLGGNLCKHI